MRTNVISLSFSQQTNEAKKGKRERKEGQKKGQKEGRHEERKEERDRKRDRKKEGRIIKCFFTFYIKNTLFLKLVGFFKGNSF